MEDTRYCLICQSKLRNCHIRDPILGIKNKSSAQYLQRKCPLVSHFFLILLNKETDQVEYLKLSWNPSTFISIDFSSDESKISFFNKSCPIKQIDIPRILNTDFPHLSSLKEKISSFTSII